MDVELGVRGANAGVEWGGEKIEAKERDVSVCLGLASSPSFGGGGGYFIMPFPVGRPSSSKVPSQLCGFVILIMFWF